MKPLVKKLVTRILPAVAAALFIALMVYVFMLPDDSESLPDDLKLADIQAYDETDKDTQSANLGEHDNSISTDMATDALPTEDDLPKDEVSSGEPVAPEIKPDKTRNISQNIAPQAKPEPVKKPKPKTARHNKKPEPAPTKQSRTPAKVQTPPANLPQIVPQQMAAPDKLPQANDFCQKHRQLCSDFAGKKVVNLPRYIIFATMKAAQKGHNLPEQPDSRPVVLDMLLPASLAYSDGYVYSNDLEMKLVGRFDKKGFVRDAQNRVIGMDYALAPHVVVNSKGHIFGHIDRQTGNVLDENSQIIGTADVSPKTGKYRAANHKNSFLGRVIYLSDQAKVMRDNCAVGGRYLADGRVIDEKGELLGTWKPTKKAAVYNNGGELIGERLTGARLYDYVPE